MDKDIKIYFTKQGHLSQATFISIRDFVNEAYAKGEEGMWREDTNRTSVEELQNKVKAGHLIVAEQGKEIIGVMLLHRTEDINTAEFGMLTVKPQFMKRGVGGQLINYAEEWAVSNGMTMMRLELLTPSDWKQPAKEFVKKWYSRLGYVPQRTEPFEKDYPHLAPSLKTACDFTEWTKRLVE